MPKIAVVLGSKNDIPKVQGIFDVLDYFKIENELKVLSAHRTPNELMEYIKSCNNSDTSFFLAAAGGAAHLPGVIASHTDIPVIGIPIANPPHSGMDSILSILEMPKGVPVLGVGANSGGPANAALFAVRVLALSDSTLKKKYSEYVANMKKKVLEA